ncbi:MAG: tetratricopeptide repeat-containing sensor histidine kinase [Cyclobacteriaceae bacterium]
MNFLPLKIVASIIFFFSISTLFAQSQYDDVPGLAYELVRDSSALSELEAHLQAQINQNNITKDSAASFYWNVAKETMGLHDFVLTRQIIQKAFGLLSDDSDSELVANLHISLSEMAMEEDEIVEAIELLTVALDIYREEQDSVSYLFTLRRIGNCYDYFGDHDTAMSFYEECVEMANELEREDVLANCYNNIAGILTDDGKRKEGIEYYKRGLEISNRIGDKILSAKLYHNSSIAYRKLELFAEAENALNTSLKMSTEMDDLRSTGFAYQGFGFLYNDQGRYDLAEDYMNKTLEIGQKISNSQLQINAREVLDEIYAKTGRFEEAYRNLKTIAAEDDSLWNLENSELIQSIQNKYRVEKQERELAETKLKLREADYALENKTNQQFALLIGLVLLSLIAMLVYGGYLLRKRANDLLKAKNEEIEHLNKTKSRWFVNVAHDLRSPISLIKTPLSRVLSEFQLDEEVETDLRLVDKSATKLNNLVNEILELSRMESGEVVLNEEVFDFNFLAKDAVAAFEKRAEENNIELSFRAASETLIRGDRSKLRKVMDNLLDNAFKFTERGGKIEVLVELNDRICIYVIDNGPGIKEAELPRIFDRFYISKEDDQEVRRGSGVGLALSKEIATLHNAKLTVRSEYGQGSSFRLCLPKERIA